MKEVIKYIIRYFPIKVTYTKYSDRRSFDYGKGSTLIPFLKSYEQMWTFRIWKGNNIFVHTFGVGIRGLGICLVIPRLKL